MYQKVSCVFINFNTFNEYFPNITKDLNLRESTGNINFENEESCKKIKENFGNETFSFETISKKDVLDLIKQLSGNKATVSNDIPILVLKKSVSAYYETLTDIFNNCIRSGTFPEILEISHFSYCPLIWMFCSKKSAKKINAVNERSLRIIRNDYQSLYP